MHTREVTDPQAWDQALLSLPDPHILQSWAWGAFKEHYGWQATRLLFEESGQTVAAASILQRRAPWLPLSILYVPKGPALDWTNADLVQDVLAILETLARRRRALFVKIDPDLYYPDQAPGFCTRPACAPIVAEKLTARGWRFSNDQIQFCNTVLLDLCCPEEVLLAAMKPKTRYNLRLAGRRRVTVRAGDRASDLETFYHLYATTAQRDGFTIRPPAYYREAWGSFLEAGQAHLLLAEVEDQPQVSSAVAGLLLFTFGPTAWYMYGASSDRHRERMPNYLLQWQAIRCAKAAGCTLYDLWGAPDRLEDSDPMWGVYRFKEGLGGRLARGLGAWDFPVSRPAYRAYTVLMPHLLAQMRRGQRTEARQLTAGPG
jgi:peptidoglycan pentaglycine glycine transferase (the first glycine)